MRPGAKVIVKPAFYPGKNGQACRMSPAGVYDSAMKILTNCVMPFSLAHGGQAIQIQQTMAALQGLGLEVEPIRWWDESQTGDVIHYFGRMPADQIRFAHAKKIKVVMAEFLTAQSSRSRGQLRMQKLLSRGMARFVPRTFTTAFNWDSYRLADAFIALTSWEKHLMEYMFDAEPGKTFVVPNGVEPEFFNSPPSPRGPWLVCTATITERKRVLELAQAAVAAETPVWIIGRSYADNDSYAQKFLQLAKQNPKHIRYEGAISDRTKLAAIYRAARGFVLLSTMESLSLSALEAAACECPLLLSDLPWAHGAFANGAQFCPVTNSVSVTAGALRSFYDAAPNLPCPPRPATWPDVARQLQAVYEKVVAT
jgi:glycosyltransferase involved in cell wall biosynthesis